MLTTQNPIALKPRFVLQTSKNQAVFMSEIKQYFQLKEYPIKNIEQHVFVDVPFNLQHVWSPQMHLQIEQQAGVLLVKGNFGPRPQIWTLFMFFHFVIGTSFLGFLMKAYSDYLLKQFSLLSVIMLILLPIAWFGLYLIGIYGKEKSRPQMETMYEGLVKLV